MQNLLSATSMEKEKAMFEQEKSLSEEVKRKVEEVEAGWRKRVVELEEKGKENDRQSREERDRISADRDKRAEEMRALGLKDGLAQGRREGKAEGVVEVSFSLGRRESWRRI